jgi:hypothetical protein
MPSDPPYIPNLPPHLAQEFLDKWPTPNRPGPQQFTPVSNPVPPQGHLPRSSENSSVHTDPLEGTWVTAGGSWQFTKDTQGYQFQETSALGVVGQGRATCENGHVQIDYVNNLLGRITCTLALSGNVMQGSFNMGPIAMPIHLQRT